VTFAGAEKHRRAFEQWSLGHRLFGYPRISAGQLIHWIADWVSPRLRDLG